MLLYTVHNIDNTNHSFLHADCIKELLYIANTICVYHIVSISKIYLYVTYTVAHIYVFMRYWDASE